MKRITFSAQEEAIEGARRFAARKGTTLNALFRTWLSELDGAMKDDVTSELEALWKRTGSLKVGRKLTRDDMNER